MGALAFIVPLFVPGHRPDRFAKAAGSGADAVIIDLEDAVPADAKADARDALTADLPVPVLVRVNGAGTPWHTGDIAAVARLRPAAVMLPKAENPVVLDTVAAVLGPTIPIVALIESTRGLAAARTLATHAAVARIAFGSIDFCADLGCAHVREALLAARAELVLASRLAGRPAPVDGVTTGIDDAAQISEDTRHARALGFGGKLAIHPRQVEAIRSGFLPDEAEMAWAIRMLASGEGATAVDGAMVDEPVRIRARAILAARSGARQADAGRADRA